MTKKSAHILIFFLISNTFMISNSMRYVRSIRSFATKSKTKILKLGGSVITDKSSPVGIARENVIDNIAKQIALCSHPIILTHGTGSFGHPLYHAYNLEHEFNLAGTIKVYKAEKQLNNIVMESLHEHGIKAICIDPMYNIICENGRIKNMPVELIEQLIAQGFVPVLFGTMVIDTKRKAYGLSSDQITMYLAEQLQIPDIGFGSSEYGVYDEYGDVIPEINPVNFEELSKIIGGSEHVDVSGGMLGKVKEALEANGLKSLIFNAAQKDSVSRFLHNDKPTGTGIVS